MDTEFDLDVTFEEEVDQQLIDSLSQEALLAAIQSLPKELAPAARAILIEKRSFSDVSQDLGIRQPELVRFIHRSKLLITRRL